MTNQRFVIEGGHPIGGRIRPSGNKNAALPLIAATLLSRATRRAVPAPPARALLVNGADARDITTPLSDGDHVHIIGALSGG